MKIRKITRYKLHIPGMRGTLSNKCKEREDIPLFSNTKVGSVACIDLCPLFLKKVGKFIICKGKVKNA